VDHLFQVDMEIRRQPTKWDFFMAFMVIFEQPLKKGDGANENYNICAVAFEPTKIIKNLL
jgi:hypothetical protein